MAGIVAAVLLLSTALLAEDNARKLVEQLGADEPAAREEASRALEALLAEDDTGDVEALVVEASRSPDAEVAARAGLLLAQTDAPLVVLDGSCARTVDAEKGTVLWERKGKCTAWAFVRRLCANAFIAPEEGGLECVTLGTGRTRWKLEGKPKGVRLGDREWIGWDERELVLASPVSKGARWRHAEEPAGRNLTPLEADALGDLVYVRVPFEVIALRAATGEVAWRVRDQALCSMRAAPGLVLLTSLSLYRKSLVRALDAKSGKQVWEAEVAPAPAEGAEADHSHSNKAGERTVFRAYHSGGRDVALLIDPEREFVRGYDLSNGALLWNHDAAYGPWTVTPDGSTLWLAWTSKPTLIRIDLATGETASEPDKFLECDAGMALAASDDCLYIAFTPQYQLRGPEERRFPLVNVEMRDRRTDDRVCRPNIVFNGPDDKDDPQVRLSYEWLGERLLLRREDKSGIGILLTDPTDGRVIQAKIFPW